MSNKVLSDINVAEAYHEELKQKRTESCRKASTICPEGEIEALGEWDGSTPEQLSAQLNTLQQRLLRENQQCSYSIEDLRMLYDKKQWKISKKQETYEGSLKKLEVFSLFSRLECLPLRYADAYSEGGENFPGPSTPLNKSPLF